MRSRAFIVTQALIALPALVGTAEGIGFLLHNRSNSSIVVDGVARDYELHVPLTYAARNRAVPLVISLHGAALWGVGQRDITHWNDVADREGFIVAYPSARRGSGPRVWHDRDGAEQSADVRFIDRIIDTLSAHYHIDPMRIYVNGLSNGGAMTFTFSCLSSHRVAAVGLVASAQTLPFRWCRDTHPLPLIDFHGTADPQVPYTGGYSAYARAIVPDVRRWVAAWAARNRCARSPDESRVALDARLLAFAHCAGHADVVLYTLDGGGHAWPGGQPLPEWWVGRTPTDIDATALMWAFFAAHPRGDDATP